MTNTNPTARFPFLSLQLCLFSSQLDLFPDVQEAYVAELIRTNNVKDLNV